MTTKGFIKISALLFLIQCFMSIIGHADEVWANQDIGSVGVGGSSAYDAVNDTFSVTGSGVTMAGVSDGCQFSYISLSGNVEVIARVASLSGSNGYSEAGIMFRESNTSDARYVRVAVSQQNGVTFGYRAISGSQAISVLGESVSAPVWLRLVRSGATMAGYFSIDGTSWVLVGQVAPAEIFDNTLNCGLYVSNHDNSALASALFEGVSVLTHVPQRDAGLKLWLRADVGVERISGAVSLWADQSGSGNDVFQGTAGNRPTYQVGVINGQPVVRFNGTSHTLVSAAAIKPSNITVMAVYRPTAAGTSPTLISQSYNVSATNGWGLRAGANSNLVPYADLNINATATTTSSATTTALNSAHLLAATYDGAERKIYLGGVLKATTAVAGSLSYGTATVFRVGSYLGNNYFNGDLAEVLVYDRALSDSERNEVEAYLYAKYGVGTQPTTGVPVVSVSTGTYATAQSVTLSGVSGAQLYYTLDGSAPTTASTLYTGAFTISETTTIKVIAVKDGYQNSPMATSIITIDPSTGYVSRDGLQVWLRADALVGADGASLADWADSSGNGNGMFQATASLRPKLWNNIINGRPVVRFNGTSQYMGGVLSEQMRSGNFTVMAVGRRTATAEGMLFSVPYQYFRTVVSGSVTITYNYVSSYDLNCKTNALHASAYVGNSVFASAIGSIPTASGASATFGGVYDGMTLAAYHDGQMVGSSTQAGAVAYESSLSDFYLGARMQAVGAPDKYFGGDVAEVLVYSRALSVYERRDVDAYFYAKYGVGNQPVVDVPLVDVPSGTYSSGKLVSISGIPGALLYYTLDGSTPTAASTLYTGPITISSTATLKVIAIKPGYVSSGVVSSDIRIDGGTVNVSRNGLQLWLLANTLSQANNSVVSLWRDQSGNQLTATQSNSADQPIFKTGILNGLPVVRFTASQTQYLEVANAPGLNPTRFSIIAVAKRTSGTASAVIVGKGATGYSLRMSNMTTANSYVSSSIANSASGAITSGGFHVIKGVYDQVSNRVYVNSTVGTLAAYTSATPVNAQNMNIGGFLATTSFDGDIAEILVYNRALTDSERVDLDGYFKAKYGIGSTPVMAAPSISVATGTYAASQTVAITASPDATIYYTVDGSAPTVASTLYSGPLTIDESTTVRAIAVKQDYQASSVVTSVITIDSNTTRVSRNGLQLWLKADSLTQAGGTAVSQWDDQSGNSNNATQGTASNKPVLQTSVLNGKPVVRFSAASKHYVSVPDVPSLDPSQVSVIAVAKRASGTASAMIAGKGTGYSLRMSNLTTANSYINGNIANNSASVQSGAFNVLASVYNQIENRIYSNGSAGTPTSYSTAIPANSNALTVGGLAAANNFDGDIAEVLVYSRPLSDVERAELELYFLEKYNVGIAPISPVPVFDVRTGTYASAQAVTLSGPAGAVFYYTLDGSAPLLSSTVYDSPIPISATTTIKAIAVLPGYQPSAVSTAVITIDGSTGYVSRTGLQLWLKADSLGLSGGTAVAAWADQSGNGYDVAQATAGSRPTYQTGVINGQPVVRFSGTSQSLVSSAAIKPTNITIMAVYRPMAAGSTPTVISQTYNAGATNGWGLRAGSSANLTPYADLNIGGSTTTTSTATVTTVNTPQLLTATYDGVARKAYLGGVLKANTTASGSLTYGTVASFTVGSHLATNYLNGDIAEILVYNRALSDAERQDVEAYVYAKYGVGVQPVTPAPALSVKTGTYMGTQIVTLSGPAGAQLYYTLDGSTPTAASIPYTGPITVSATTTLKVVAIKDGYQASSVAASVITIDGSTGYVSRSGLQLWLKADALGLTGGAAVAAWADQSGNGNDATQGTVGNRPTYQANVINGQPVVRFTGSSAHYLSVPNVSALNPERVSVVAVVKRASGTSSAVIAGKGTGYSLRMSNLSTANSYINGNVANNSTSVTSGAFNVLAAVYNQATNEIYSNGSAGTPTSYTTAIPTNTTALTVGGLGTSNNFDGDIAEVLIYDRPLSEGERSVLEVSLLAKYGIYVPTLASPVLSLPAGALSEPSQVAITAPTGATIYYTLDGTTPTTSSLLYTGPIHVAYSRTIKAIAVQSGFLSSAVTSVGYTLDDNLWPAPVNNPSDTTGPVINLQLPVNALQQ